MVHKCVYLYQYKSFSQFAPYFLPVCSVLSPSPLRTNQNRQSPSLKLPVVVTMTNMMPTMITEELTKPEKASEESSTPVTNNMQIAPRKITSDLSRVNNSAAIIATAVISVIQASTPNPNSIIASPFL